MRRTAITFQRGLGLLWLALFTPIAASAPIEFDPERDVPLSATVQPAEVPAGGDGRLLVTVNLPPDVHITGRATGFFYLEPSPLNGIVWGVPSFPTGEIFEGDTVYRGNLEFSVPFKVAGNAEQGVFQPAGVIGYQICTEKKPVYCTAPVQRRFDTVLKVIPGAVTSGVALSPAASSPEDESLEARVRRALESGSPVALLWVYLGGLLLSFTPCVYPIIPITIAYVGAHSGANRWRAISISLVFVLGLALVYSVLGVAAAATGGVFGFNTQNPWVVGVVVVVFMVMGVGMLGAFEVALPPSIQTKLSSHGKTGYLGALLVGGTTGLVAAPCVGPVLVALLGWVSSTGKLSLGFIYLFVFACGLGTLFLVIGTFAGALTALPKSGGWMEHVKHAFGLVMIAAAYNFARTVVPGDWFILAVGMGLLLLAGYWGAYSQLAPDAGIWKRLNRGVAMFALLAGAFYVLLGLARLQGVSMGAASSGATGATLSNVGQTAPNESSVVWIWNDEAAARSRAVAENKPILMDFWADWCAACKELDHKTFNDPRIAAILNEKLITLKMDGSKVTNAVRSTWSRFGVKGLPTVLIMSPDGQTEKARLEAFRPPEQMLPWLQKTLAAAP